MTVMITSSVRFWAIEGKSSPDVHGYITKNMSFRGDPNLEELIIFHEKNLLKISIITADLSKYLCNNQGYICEIYPMKSFPAFLINRSFPDLVKHDFKD